MPSKRKKMRQEKRKKRRGEKKAKSKSQDCCVTFKPKKIVYLCIFKLDTLKSSLSENCTPPSKAPAPLGRNKRSVPYTKITPHRQSCSMSVRNNFKY